MPDVSKELEQALNLHRRGQLDDAERLYQEILAVAPGRFDALQFLGMLELQKGRPEAAVELLAQALRIDPKHALAQFHLGCALQELKRDAEAVAAFDRAIAARPDLAEVWNNRANALRALGRREEALASADRAIALKPDFPAAHYNRGNVLRDLRRYDAALASYDRALARKIDFVEALHNRGNALRDLARHAEALASYDAAIAIRPNFAEAYYNRGVALEDLQHYGEALESYDRAIALDPAHANAHASKSYIKLRLGDFAAGWPLYEWRWHSGNFTTPRRDFPQPLWRGAEIPPGQTILLHAEQGWGDTIQFCRYAPLVAARGARVVAEVPRPLARLLAGLAGVEAIVAEGDPLPAFDLHCPLMSLPGLFGTTVETIPASVPYLAAELARVALWRARLPPGDLRIGIHWQGNPSGKVDRGRSAPLANFAPLALVPGVRLISLQKYHGLDQLDRLPAGMTVETLGPDFDAGPGAFLDTAAVMTSLDLVISTDTAIVHLAGALGRPVWVPI